MKSDIKYKTRTGLDILEERKFSNLKNCKVGLLVNPASVNRQLEHITTLIHSNKKTHLAAIFGPQHGFYGNTQDNMIEWEGFTHSYFKCPVYSLYGKFREPKSNMLENIEVIVIDLPDAGSRYYTFLWTALLMLKACEKKDIRIIVLDRPNPITGTRIEGPGLEENFLSFVGLHPMIVRHGLTTGECLRLIHKELNLKTDLEIIPMENWYREMWYDETGLPWVIPSPNMPTINTATVYPGGCLIEGTNLSEGRGTTTPFEIIGAPYIEPEILKKDLMKYRLKGVFFRPLHFEPTFQKYGGKLCGGVHIHVTDRNEFEPVKTFVAILLAIRKRYENESIWRPPPYEYEYEKLPFDILSGSNELREQIDRGEDLKEIVAGWKKEEKQFNKRRMSCLLYGNSL